MSHMKSQVLKELAIFESMVEAYLSHLNEADLMDEAEDLSTPWRMGLLHLHELEAKLKA